MIDFRLLGEVALFRADKQIGLGPGRQRNLLAILVLANGRPATVPHLIDRLWGDRPPQRSREALYVHVARLRTALKQGGVTLRRAATGYLCDHSRDAVDLFRFEDLVAKALQLPEPKARAAILRQALVLWHGEPLTGLTGDWAERTRERLRQQWMSAVIACNDAELAAGNHAAVMTGLAELVARHPLVEPLVAQLMLAMHRSGRHAEALAVYRQARTHMAEELGLEPGPALRELEHSILTSDPRLDMPRSAIELSQAGRNQLPAPGILIGREEEVARIATGLRHRPPVIAIHGPAGAGKSALALHLAHRLTADYPDGQLYADLRGGGPGARPALAGWLLRGAGFAACDDPAAPAQAAALLRSVMASRRLLILLDDVSCATDVASLVPSQAGSLVIVTSRRAMPELDNAFHVGLTALTVQASTRLIAQLAGGDRVVAEPAAAAEIVRYCEQLPLALHIAGSQLARRPSQRLSVLAARLADEHRRLDTLQSGQRSVRVSLSESCSRLDDTAALSMQCAGLLSLPTITATVIAAALGLSDAEVEAAFDHLADLRLLESAGPDRWRMPDLVRLFALEQAHRRIPAAARDRLVRRGYQAYLDRMVWAASRLDDLGILGARQGS